MSDEVRSNPNPVPPATGGLPIDPVDGPKSLELDFPAPDVDLVDSGPILGPVGVEPETAGGGVTVLPNKDISSLKPQAASDLAPPRPSPSERPPPSQRVATQQRLEAMATPVPPSPGGVKTLPAPSGGATLPAPAPVLGDPGVAAAPAVPAAQSSPTATSPIASPPSPAALPALESPVPPPSGLESAASRARSSPLASPGGTSLGGLSPPRPAPLPERREASSSFDSFASLTEPAPPPRMLSEPAPLAKPTGPASPSRTTQRPGLVEPKRIIEVLGSNVPVLDSALEEEAIEDLDESEAHELAETPLPASMEADLELDLVVEDFPPSSVAASSSAAAEERDDSLVSAAPGISLEASIEASLDDSLDRRVKAPPNKRRRPPPPSSRSQEMRRVEPPPAGARKWWEEMFSEEFLRAIPILSPRQLEREVNFIDEALAVSRGGRILDLACGAGQHAVELATRGYDLVGFDLSQSQLDWAGGLAQERNQRLQFTYGDMRELGYHEAFDAVYSWNTSFGFFEEDKNLDVALRVFRALRPGGRFLLDVINRDFVVDQQPGQTWFEGDGCVCIDDVSIDFITSRMKVKRTLMLTNGKNRECNYSLRIYGLHELGKILHDVGFKILNVSGRPEMPGVFFGAASPRIIILAVKP
jgi:SAM-dependent methyltransferase